MFQHWSILIPPSSFPLASSTDVLKLTSLFYQDTRLSLDLLLPFSPSDLDLEPYRADPAWKEADPKIPPSQP